MRPFEVTQMQVSWIKSTQNEWLRFETFNLEPVTAEGVYIIWHGGTTPRVVRLGQGDIKARLSVHRNDPAVTKYRDLGALLVTWASVPAGQRGGVERYLANQYPPLVGDAFPEVQPIAVNSPWS
jgi:hypothetical protein